MNFFEHQTAARRASARLVFLFVLAVLGIVAAVDLAAWLVAPSWRMLAFTSGVTLLTILFGSLYRTASLGGGGEAVAQQMGGTLVPADTTDPSLRRLRTYGLPTSSADLAVTERMLGRPATPFEEFAWRVAGERAADAAPAPLTEVVS